MPPDVRFFPSPSDAQEPNYNVDVKVDYWLPDRLSPRRLKSLDWDVVGRLRPGVTLAAAQAELATMTARQAQSERDFEGITPKLFSLKAQMNREGNRLLLPVAGAV